jgi:precorrin-8X/cobalt-precorrin-8 methylmutase
VTERLDYIKDGDEIYRRSFATIRAETDLSGIPDDLTAVAVRMVHACGMVDVVDDLDFSPGVGRAARSALQGGAPVLVDAMMVQYGVTRSRLPAENDVLCMLGDPTVGALPMATTALFRLLELLRDGAPRPAAILGIPVGFVGAAESKDALARGTHEVPWLTVHGRRGGSALVAAAVNALASERE